MAPAFTTMDAQDASDTTIGGAQDASDTTIGGAQDASDTTTKLLDLYRLVARAGHRSTAGSPSRTTATGARPWPRSLTLPRGCEGRPVRQAGLLEYDEDLLPRQRMRRRRGAGHDLHHPDGRIDGASGWRGERRESGGSPRGADDYILRMVRYRRTSGSDMTTVAPIAKVAAPARAVAIIPTLRMSIPSSLAQQARSVRVLPPLLTTADVCGASRAPVARTGSCRRSSGDAVRTLGAVQSGGRSSGCAKTCRRAPPRSNRR
jgi:hypothetical protein